MNSSARPPTRTTSAPPVDFLSLVPTIQRHIGFAFRRVPPAFRKDVLQEALVMTFVFYRRLVDQGKQKCIFATPLARFAVGHLRDGRRVGLSRSRRDALCPFVARRQGFLIEPIDRIDSASGRWTLMSLSSSDAPVPDQVAFRLDFPRWMSTQTRRDQRLIHALAYGDTTSEAARRFRISPARVSQLRLQFYQSWCAFQGQTSTVPARVAS